MGTILVIEDVVAEMSHVTGLLLTSLDHPAIEQIRQWLYVDTIRLVIGQESLPCFFIPTVTPTIPQLPRIGATQAPHISATRDAKLMFNGLEPASIVGRIVQSILGCGPLLAVRLPRPINN